MRVKYILIDHRKKPGSDYKKEVHELDVDTDETDVGDIGRHIRDTIYKGRKRYYVKVLGVGPTEGDEDEDL